jgi:glutamate/tyrosine decarboxylase-like PLP-dependent enzyme
MIPLMTDPIEDREAIDKVVALVANESVRFLAELDASPALQTGAAEAAERFGGPLPEQGEGAVATLTELLRDGLPAAVRSSGPRMFHFVTGGVTPAALGADWLTSVLDQNAFAWVNTPLASRLETVALDWLKDLFGLPASWGGILTSGATMANVSALAAARHWYGERHGVDVEEAGLAALPPIPVLTGGSLHPSASKAFTMLGIGRSQIRSFARDGAGRMDVDALGRALADLDGAPAIVAVTAGEPNAADADPIAEAADLAEEHGAWLHVDGAFGLFGRVTPESGDLLDGVDRAHSVIADGHKWLNVPYDCGFAFVSDPSLLPKAFAAGAAYLPALDDPRPNLGYRSPEMSRRARSLAVWATLRAYGRAGHREMIERHLALARTLGAVVEAAPDFELLAPVSLNIVCFRYAPPALAGDEAALNRLNQELGQALLDDGRVYVGTTTYDGHVAFRPAIVNWRTTEPDVRMVVDVIRELGERATAG